MAQVLVLRSGSGVLPAQRTVIVGAVTRTVVVMVKAVAEVFSGKMTICDERMALFCTPSKCKGDRAVANPPMD